MTPHANKVYKLATQGRAGKGVKYEGQMRLLLIFL